MRLGGIYVGVRGKTDKYARDLAKAKTMSTKAAVHIQHQLDRINFKRVGIAAVAFAGVATLAFKKVIDALAGAGLRNSVKVMVGGAPVSDHFAESVGADGYGADAGEAAQKAKQLCGMTNRRLCPN